ncbi:MAG TPA: GtrA family protein [Candidatus Udaeobacter sp.]|nr:GtrA family protein [Candidatus Udaeobacter sp.]
MFKTVRKRLIAQFIAFNIVGLLNTAVDFLLFTILIWLGTYYLLAQVIAYGAGMINSFVLNSRYTFGNDGRIATKRQQLGMSVRFIAWNGILLGITLLLLAALTEWWGMSEVIAKLIVTAVTVLLNFYGSKKWVFASGGSQTESS